MSFKCIRSWEETHRAGKIDGWEATQNCQRELGNIRDLVDETTKLARTAAVLRGQRITVIRPKEDAREGEGGAENRNSIPQENVAALEAANDATENEATG